MPRQEPDHVVSARAVYDHSVEQYLDAIGSTVSERFEAPIDRAVLHAFAEDLAPHGKIIDIGCGPGRITSYLADRGLDVRGVDISPRMIAAARSAHPELTFDVGSLTEVPVPDGSMSGAVCWYSIIATPPSELPAVWNELDRVLEPGGQLLVAFQAGANESVERREAYGSAATLTLYRHDVDDVAASLEKVGFVVGTVVHRAATLEHETTPQAFVIAESEGSSCPV